MLSITSTILLLLSAFGTVQMAAGVFAVWAFARKRNPAPAELPPVTVLKPVCGSEPLLETAIQSFCEQDYPHFQLLIGAQDANDPALDVVRRLQRRFPGCDIGVVIDPRLHGANRKISNLMNMMGDARHDTLVIADSDLHVRPDYLRQVVAALSMPGTGLVTTVCGGEATVGGFAARLGALHISYTFLPGALMAAAMGRQDCLGGTMALHRETLDRVDGLDALVGHLADDNVLGQRVRKLGLQIRLAATVPAMSVPDSSMAAVWQHELRWSRTIRALAPVAYGASILQFPLFWAGLAILASAGGVTEISVFIGVWAARCGAAWAIDRRLAPIRPPGGAGVPGWLFPLRDMLSAVEIAASFCGNSVTWRGHAMLSDRSLLKHATAAHLPKVAPAFVAPVRELDVIAG